MEKVLIAVDETEGSRAVVQAFRKIIRKPEIAILVHIQRLEGDSHIIDMLGEPEMSTLRESLKGSEHKEALDRKAEKILAFYRREIESGGVSVQTVTRDGPPSEEILKLAREERVDLIITGYSCKNLIQRLFKGSVSRDIEKRSPVPVLVTKNRNCRERSSGRGLRVRIRGRKWEARLAKAPIS
jgi:nucleotide-binding universal stress UspA family protein